MDVDYIAVVTAKNGGTVNVRKNPSTNSAI